MGFIITNFIDTVDKELYEWLKPPDSSSKQNEFRKGRAEGTGEWLFKSAKFEEWRTQPGAIFWIHAKGMYAMLYNMQGPLSYTFQS